MLVFQISNPGEPGQVVEVPQPQPKPGQALIRVLRAGICNTDLEILKGYMGFTGILGHEFVGIVEAVGHDADQNEWMGKRVVGDINVGCQACQVCRKTYDTKCSQMSRNHCPNRSVLGILNHDGTFAQYLCLPISNLHVVPDSLSDETAVFAEPLAAACRIVEQDIISYKEPDKVAILGDGKLGLVIAQVLGREHAQKVGSDDHHKPVLFGKHANKLDLVADSGVTCRLIDDHTAKEYASQFDVVVDATGNPQGLQMATALCRPMGTIVLKSTCAACDNLNTAPIVIDELRVIGSRCGPMDQALQLLAEGLSVTRYITKTFPLSQADEAIRCAADKTTMKVQIICNEE